MDLIYYFISSSIFYLVDKELKRTKKIFWIEFIIISRIIFFLTAVINIMSVRHFSPTIINLFRQDVSAHSWRLSLWALPAILTLQHKLSSLPTFDGVTEGHQSAGCWYLNWLNVLNPANLLGTAVMESCCVIVAC